MYLFAGGMVPFGTSAFGPVLNALSERLVVKTMHGGDCYRVVFSKGKIVFAAQPHALRQASRDHMVYIPPRCNNHQRRGADAGDVDGFAGRVGLKTECARIRIEDRMTEDADWY